MVLQADGGNEPTTGGGCRFPSNGKKRGKDCTQIEGVSEAACDDGTCVVHSCRPGYIPDGFAKYCVWHGMKDEREGLKLRENSERGHGWAFFV